MNQTLDEFKTMLQIINSNDKDIAVNNILHGDFDIIFIGMIIKSIEKIKDKIEIIREIESKTNYSWSNCINLIDVSIEDIKTDLEKKPEFNDVFKYFIENFKNIKYEHRK